MGRKHGGTGFFVWVDSEKHEDGGYVHAVTNYHYINIPSMRTGNISVMPREREGIEFYEGGFQQEAFLIEMRSASGYSGSPVFYQIPHWYYSERQRSELSEEAYAKLFAPWLLGVNCGNFKYYNKVYEVRRGARGETYEETNLEAKSHSGLAIVVPAWKLTELLNDERLVMARKEADERAEVAKKNSMVERDVSKHDGGEGLTQDAFEEALRRASRRTSSQPEPESDET